MSIGVRASERAKFAGAMERAERCLHIVVAIGCGRRWNFL